VKKYEIFPLNLPSPARGEGKYIEIKKKFPPPGRGRERVGVQLGFFHIFRGSRGISGDTWQFWNKILGLNSQKKEVACPH
jgi:hypothetical protein